METPNFNRRIIHIDMDAFFASVEQRDNPELRGKAIAVGGGKRGVVAAASYEARKYGVFSAMPSGLALKKCPHLIFVKPRFSVYKEVSLQVMDIFKRYTLLVEPLSLDEAYLDITENKLGFKTAKEAANAIRKDIFETTQLTASAGVSFNKFLAKIASGQNKPNGITVISPNKAIAFLEKLPIEKFYGVGKKTAEHMRKVKINTGKDLMQWDILTLQKEFGKSGTHFYNMVHLLDNRPVRTHRVRKSIGAERTFENNIDSFGLMMMMLNEIIAKLETQMMKREIKGKTISLKIKYYNFEINTRSKTLKNYTYSSKTIRQTIKNLLEQEKLAHPVRLLGVSISNLNTQKEKLEKGEQMELDL